ncbi:MAG: metal-dependent hydrolase [Comamonadaceae bacterium]|nr:MAG: metal-dependent hydrolase [Comamonadaceae bacterium]
MKNEDSTVHTEPTPNLIVRKLEIDLRAGFGRHWNGGDAFLTQFNNALSMSFPVGEQSFIDSVRDCAKLLPDAADAPQFAALHRDIAQFIGQEATHRHLHGLYNAHLDKQGLVNRWETWASKRLAEAKSRNIDPRHFLAVTAAYEHLTALLSDYLLRHDTALEKAEPMMRMLWCWHAAEETEHRAVAFNLYQAVGGNHAWRIRWYVYTLVAFSVDAGRQTVLNLWHDGTLFKPSTWWSALKFFWGPNGLVRRCTGPALSYFRRDFHPDHETARPPEASTQELAQRWLRENAASWRAVR